MHVIGTAGHVDHGKSTLVAALTGTHPDRLKEEQEREMTIDLGFAWMTLPSGESVGIVDVPGHRDFIENMLAGVGGIDAALLVVAADEGVMPQTREHLAILDLLQIPAGVIALTKIDLAPGDDWLELVSTEVRGVVQGTVLAQAPIVPVSARTGQGLPDLISALQACLAERPSRPDLARPRLPVDRVFTMPGFGTVVTGTLIDGSLRVGEEIEILPGGLRGRIRGLQTHRQKEQTALPGSRTAVNVSGLDVHQIRRGDVLTHVGKYRPTRLLDVHFKLLPDSSAALSHNSQVKLFLGSAEVMARVRLLGTEVLPPGQEGWLQLDLHEPVVAVRGDHYILRRPSPSETLGGGVVVDPSPTRHRRFDSSVLAALEALRQGTPSDVLLQAFLALGITSLQQACARSHLSNDQAVAALQELTETGQLCLLEEGPLHPQADLLAAPTPLWETLTRRAFNEVEAFHHTHPLRRGIPREALKSLLKLPTRVFHAALKSWLARGILEEHTGLLHRPGFTPTFTPQQQAAVDHLMAEFASAPFSPPSVKQAQAELGNELYQALLDLGRLVQVSAEVVFRREDYEEMLCWVQDHFEKEPTLTVGQFRDQFNTSRKYALGFLEHLDALGITLREGDFRRLKR